MIDEIIESFIILLNSSEIVGIVSLSILVSNSAVIIASLIGIPIGISSFCYLLICAITSYIRQITLSPKFINDWLSFIVTVLLINSIQVIILDLIFLYQVDYMDYLINSGFTFLFYPLFFILFNILNSKISLKKND